MYDTYMVGNIEDATYALQLDDSSDEYLDEGGYRRAFVVNGVVYKVPYVDVNNFWPRGRQIRHTEWVQEFESGCIHSEAEWEHYLLYRDKFPSHPFYLPEMSLWVAGPDNVPIIAAEWITGESDWGQVASDFSHLMPKTHLMDLCDSNVILSGNRYYIIDLGC
jgi:hypothetical protein